MTLSFSRRNVDVIVDLCAGILSFLFSRESTPEEAAPNFVPPIFGLLISLLLQRKSYANKILTKRIIGTSESSAANGSGSRVMYRSSTKPRHRGRRRRRGESDMCLTYDGFFLST